MGKTRRCMLMLSEQQDDVVHLWTPVTLVPGDNQCAKIVLTRSDDTTNNAERRSLCEEIASHDFGCLPKSTITNLQKRVLVQKKSTPSRSPCSYNLRASAGCTYVDTDVLDDVTYCKQCEKEYVGVCSLHFMLVLNKQVPRDGSVRERARLTVPWPLFISDSKMEAAGEGVWTCASLPQGLVFGPYEGHIFKYVPRGAESGYAWRLKSSKCCSLLVDSFKKSSSNWLRYVNCAQTPSEVNLDAFQYKGNIYYVTCCDIKSDTELLVWYGEEYGKELGLSSTCYNEISVPAAQEETHHLQDIPTLTGLFPVTDRASRMKPEKPKVPVEGLSVADATQSLAKNDSRDDIKKLSKSQSELEHLFITARLKPGKNDSTEVSRDGSVKDRARITAPWPLYVEKSKVIGAGDGIWTSATLPKGLVFGPCEGHIIKGNQKISGYGWKIHGRPDIDIDAEDTSVSNWARYINCARNYKERNIIAMQIQNEIFYVTNCIIKSGTELMVWYGAAYGRLLGISLRDFFKPQLKELDLQRWCSECHILFTSRKYLLQHQAKCKKNTGMVVQGNGNMGPSATRKKHDRQQGRQVKRKYDTECVETGMEEKSKLTTHQAMKTSPHNQNENLTKCSSQNTRIRSPSYSSVITGKSSKHDRKHKGSSDYCVTSIRSSEYDAHYNLTQDLSVTSSRSSNDDDAGPINSSDHGTGPNRTSDCVSSPSNTFYRDSSTVKPFDCNNHDINLSDHYAGFNRSLDCGNSSERPSDHGKSPSRSLDHCSSPKRSCDSWGTPNKFSDNNGTAICLNDCGATLSNSFALEDSCNRLSDQVASPSSPTHHDSFNKASNIGGSSNSSCVSPSRSSYDTASLYRLSGHIANTNKSFDHGTCSDSSSYVTGPNLASDHGTGPDLASDHCDSPNMASDHVIRSNMASYGINPKNFSDDDPSHQKSFSHGTSLSRTSDYATVPDIGSSHVTKSNRPFGYDPSPSHSSDHVSNYASPLYHSASPKNSIDHEAIPKISPGYDSCFNVFSNHNASPNRLDQEVSAGKPFDQGAIANVASDEGAIFIVSSQQDVSPKGFSVQEIYPSRSFDQRVSHTGSHDYKVSSSVSSEQGSSPSRCYDHDYFKRSSVHINGPSKITDHGACSNISLEFPFSPRRPSDQGISPNVSSDRVIPSRPFDLGTRQPDQDYFRRSPNHSIGPSMFGVHDVSANMSFQYRFSPSRCSDDAFLIKSTDHGVSLSSSSDWVFGSSSSSHHEVSSCRLPDMGVSHKRSSDQGVSSIVSSDQEVSPSRSHDHAYLNRSLDHSMCQSNSLNHSVNPNLPNESDVSLKKFSDCGVSHNRSHDPFVSHSGPNDFRSSPGKPDEFHASPSKSSDCDVSPKRTCNGDMNPKKVSDLDVRHESENEISSCSPFNLVSSSSYLDNNVDPEKSPDLFWTLNRSSHHTVCGSGFINHDDTLNKSSDPSSSSKRSSECVNLCISSDLGVSLTRYPGHGVYPQLPTVPVGSRNSSSPKISLASTSSSPVYCLPHNNDVSYCSMTPTDSGHLEKPSRFSDHVVSPIRSSDDTVSSNRSSGSGSLNGAHSPHKSSCHTVISYNSSCKVHPRASLGHFSPCRSSDDVIPRRSSTRDVSPRMYPDNLGCWLSDNLFSGPDGRPSRSADNVVRPRWSSDHIVHPNISSDKIVCVHESSDVSTNYDNAIRSMSCCCCKVSLSKSSNQSPHLSKFSDLCGSLKMPYCNNSSPAYFSHHRANPGSSFHSTISGRLSDSNIFPNKSFCHSNSSGKVQNCYIHYFKPINHNSSGNKTESMQSLDLGTDEDVSVGSTSSTKENFSCDKVDCSVDNISIVATEPDISTQPSQNEQVHLFNDGSKFGKKKFRKDCYIQGPVANQGCTKKEGLGCGLYSSKHSTKENKPYFVYDPQSVNRQNCDYKAHLREARAKNNAIGQLVGKKLQDSTTYQSTGGPSFSSAKRKVAHFSYHKNPHMNSHCQQCAVSDHGVNEPFVEEFCNNAISHDPSLNYCVPSLNCLIYSEKSKSKETFYTRLQDQDFRQAGSSHVDRHRSEWRKTCNVAEMEECKIEQEVTESPKSHCSGPNFVRAFKSCARTYPYMNPKKGSTSEFRSKKFLVEMTNISFRCSKCGQKFLSRYNHNLHVALLHPL
ncbi:uncharacterized protein [Panulirus ornatus]|uniref:uncharacterized protein n=1 Tax=Panulirus ornatus TaxID=150431 RepID=UPI003A8C7B70